MITKDNIQKVLLDLKFFSNHGVYTRHFGSADEVTFPDFSRHFFTL